MSSFLDDNNGKFLNAGINLSVILLTIFTIISLLGCSLLGVLNYEKCPKSEIFNLTVSEINFRILVTYFISHDYWSLTN